MLFPGERHTYRPDANTGWTEYWVGFKGDGADEWIRNGYFSPSTPLLNIGISPVSYTHLRAHETGRNLVCRLLLEKKKNEKKS